MPDPKKPIQLEFVIKTDEAASDPIGSFVCRLRWDVRPNGEKPCWVDVELYEIIGYTPSTKTSLYRKPDDDFTEDIELAERAVYGFVKWDGCSQFYFDTKEPSLHFDSTDSLDDFWIALRTARQTALDVMPKTEPEPGAPRVISMPGVLTFAPDSVRGRVLELARAIGAQWRIGRASGKAVPPDVLLGRMKSRMESFSNLEKLADLTAELEAETQTKGDGHV